MKSKSKKKIEKAPDGVAHSLKKYINKLMAEFGFKPGDYFISDESTLGDFRGLGEEREQFRERLDKISDKLGITIKYEWKKVDKGYHVDSDYIIEVAKKLKDKECAGIS
jgi:hypothetical protein